MEEILISDSIVLDCNHNFHYNCLKDYILFKKSETFDCPICRRSYNTNIEYQNV